MYKMSKIISTIVVFAVICFINIKSTEGILRRCYQCRSRGEQGSCKDPFKFNSTQAEAEPGIMAVPCASGWCGKIIEDQGAYRSDDYDMGIQRMCIQRGPSDSEDRCASTVYNHKKVYMCFCQGDLCNSSNVSSISIVLLLVSIAIVNLLR